MDRLSGEYFSSLVLGGVGAALGVVLLVVSRPTRTTLWLAATFLAIGSTYPAVSALVDHVPEDDVPLWMRLFATTVGLISITSAMYLRALSDTNPVASRSRTVVQLMVPLGLALGITGMVTFAAFPQEVFNDHALGLLEPGRGRGFAWFVAYAAANCVVFGAAWTALALQGVDPAERERALLTGATVPFLTASLVLPFRWSMACASVALVLGMAGQLRHMAVTGARGVFLARFLSPEVLDVVRSEGIQGVARSQSLVLSAVYCDLRGFTAYAEAVPSQAVIDLLGEYYDALGRVAAEAHATIKDYAGDGVLILVGAPLPRSDHADAAVALARDAQAACREVLQSWATAPHPLGLGIGVASGRATVGAIGSVDRMEYTAVGVPVNLAARLCSVAAAGEILVDRQTADLCSSDGLTPREPVLLKGLSEPQPVFSATF